MTPSQEIYKFIEFERTQAKRDMEEANPYSDRMERMRSRYLAVIDAITIISDAATMREALAAMRLEREDAYDIAQKLYRKGLLRASMEEYAYAREMRTLVKYVSRFEGLNA